MKPFYLAVALFLLSATTSRAQYSSLTIGLGKPLKSQSLTGVVGSPYLTDSFQVSDVITPGGKVLNNIPLRYDIYGQTVEYNNNGQIVDVTDSVSSFTYKDSLLQVNTFIKPGSNVSKTGKISYYKLLVKGNYALLKSYEASVASDQDWYTKKITKKLVVENKYFLLMNNKITELGYGKKSFLAAFQNDAAVKGKFEKLQPDVKSEPSLVAFFNKLN